MGTVIRQYVISWHHWRMIKFIETKLRKKINVSEQSYGWFHLSQFNAFRILVSLSSVLHFHCLGNPHITVITKIWVRGYSTLGDTQITGVKQGVSWKQRPQRPLRPLRPPKTPKLENKDPHIFQSSEITTSRSPMRLKVERWRQEFWGYF